MQRFYLESYGCQMNVYDTQGLERQLEDHGYTRVAAPEDADVVLVNTCSVREHAEERTLNRLAVLSRLCGAESDREQHRGVEAVLLHQPRPRVLRQRRRPPSCVLRPRPGRFRSAPGGRKQIFR